MATRTPATHSHSWLLVIAGLLVAIGAIGRALLLQREPAANRGPNSSRTAQVLPPNLARDPFLSTPPRPAPLVAARPSVRGEAAIAAVAIAAYLAVATLSFFGGDGTPDLLSVRSEGDPTAARTAGVLSARATPNDASTEILVDGETPAPEVSPQVPAEVPAVDPTPEPEPERPAQHVLRTGETLTSVAALYGITASELAAANGLTSDRILAGQVLRIPPQP